MNQLLAFTNPSFSTECLYEPIFGYRQCILSSKFFCELTLGLTLALLILNSLECSLTVSRDPHPNMKHCLLVLLPCHLIETQGDIWLPHIITVLGYALTPEDCLRVPHFDTHSVKISFQHFEKTLAIYGFVLEGRAILLEPLAARKIVHILLVPVLHECI